MCTLNIGLNVGDAEADNQLNKTISAIIKYEHIHDIKVVEKKGSSDWADERTLVVSIKGDVSMGSHYYIDLCRLLCEELNQEAIAFMIRDRGYIAFNPNYKGEEYEFNINYFKHLK
jgi:hypothetical protein